MAKTFAERIIDYMEQQNYEISRGRSEKNIIYVEGADTNGTENDDRPNYFNDLRIIIAFTENYQPVIEGIWIATTEPGFYYTDNPMNPNGAARIGFGQYKAWQVGLHGWSSPHEALVQIDEVKIHRDYNRDMKRTGDQIEWGVYGINQHHGWNHPIHDIHTAAAGCLVGRLSEEHFDFMYLAKSDRRYRFDERFVFPTTIIAGDRLAVAAQ
ncbi:hypothetical protein [Microcoleus asticus]|uniref:Uncharacterized protein n=1 Tax=Microcoleus asticus IPMA8 TaxID=2563858 RepID=A0ABX2D263_9CYAN|nr:hypothetical protein [Microcoleus asticus]NQE36727.1 hypothetical protein [Microcoleus asticus IPMA8]